jgi:hypothetical protein
MIVDASHNLHGWESRFCDRIYSSLRKRGLCLKSEGPVGVHGPDELEPHLEDAGLNSVLLLGHGTEEGLAPGERMGAYWAWLAAREWLPPLLLAVCTWESYDPALTDRVLGASDGFAPMAVAQRSPLSPREAGLYFLKFFTELDLHSEEAITGRMVWFSDSKARELLKRRRLPGLLAVRC